MKQVMFLKLVLKTLISAQLGILYVVVVGMVYHFGLM